MNAKKSQKHAKSSNSDSFSELLSLLEMDVNIYHNSKICGNWNIEAPSSGESCFHIVVSGSVKIEIPNIFNGILKTGDLLIFPREIKHSMRSSYLLEGEQRHLSYSEAQDLDGTGLLCGKIYFKHFGHGYLLDALPPFIIIRHNSKNFWINSLLEMFISENLNNGPASRVVFAKLSELLFIYGLRQYLLDNQNKVSFLSLYAHPQLNIAIECIHNNPEHDWTVEELAKKCGLSRSSFSRLFKVVSGESAGRYLNWWRMQLAWSLLKKGHSISEVAYSVGYQSESAFSKSFKSLFKVTAGDVRRTS